MLTELRVRDFAIIDALNVEFARGLCVLTGETGAGKSIIVDAIALLLGDKAEAHMVRSGCERAMIEGHFNIDRRRYIEVDALLREHNLDDEGDVVTLAREVRTSGRTICRVNGRTVSQQTLREIGELLVDVHGQSEHLSLLRVREHVNLLDRFAGLWDVRAQVAAKYAELRSVRRRLEEIERSARERERRVDMLRFQVDEIKSARLKPGEETALSEEHRRLANAEALAAWADEASAALYDGTRERPAALDQIAEARKALDNLARYDPSFAEQARALADANAVIDDVTRTVRSYRDSIEFNPQRLQRVEDRLELFKKLKRKYGETIDAVITFGETAVRELDQVENAAEHIEALQKEAQVLLAEMKKMASDLSERRKRAATVLARGVEGELQDLRMAAARFEVHIDAQEPDATGADRVEFMIAPNLGEGLKPLAKVASGGETARLMLALKAVLSREGTHAPPTLIFDEVDTGIGGRVGATVGDKLWGLTHTHQVLCITHLPQLAAYGDVQIKVEKRLADGRTSTHVRTLTRPERIEEIAQMLGTTGSTGMSSAEQLLREAEQKKGK
ncbi:MAG: DNA repair protein RecN [Chloroflexi bacterium]|nr:DNA repair protein RecN [Chloroflexota bacterium]